VEAAVSACLARLETLWGEAAPAFDALAAFPPESLDAALRQFARSRRAEALPLLRTIAEQAPQKELRKAARRALYRLAQSGVEAPAAAPRPMVARPPDRPVRAWVSGIDGSGSRAVWIVFESGPGQLSLCSLVVNDQTGIVQVAGGAISKRRLEAEIRALMETQKLPWVEIPAEAAVGLVAEALPLGPAPAEFARWRSRFSAPDAGAAGPRHWEVPTLEADARQDPTLLDHSAEILDLPELAGWFLDPAAVQSDAVSLLEARGSRIVVSDQIKAEREAAITDQVIDREFGPEASARWARRLLEMAWIFHLTGRAREAKIACATALALQDPEKPPRHLPFARTLAQRGLELAARVALGQASAQEVSRAPRTPRAPTEGGS
jgi:hypothetical protein